MNLSISRREWWLGIAAVVLAILWHATFPRYEWRSAIGVGLIRVDRWTGSAVLGRWVDGRWVLPAVPSFDEDLARLRRDGK